MYKTSAQLKREARTVLSGRWKEAVLLNIIPSILKILALWGAIAFTLVVLIGGFWFFSTITNQMSYSENSGMQIVKEGQVITINSWEDVESELTEIFQKQETELNLDFNFNGYFSSSIMSIVVVFLTISISYTFLDLLRNPRTVIRLTNRFRSFNKRDFIPLLLITIIKSLSIFLWSLLLFIPGLIQRYAYSQVYFIYKDLAESNPLEISAVTYYLSESKSLMTGHKRRLFYLDLSFIGWNVLCLLTFGLGYFLLNPYINATKAAFYLDLSKDCYCVDQSMVVAESAEGWTDF